MVAKLIRLTHKVAIQLHLVADECTICSSRSRQPVRKLLDTTSYVNCLYVQTMSCSVCCFSCLCPVSEGQLHLYLTLPYLTLSHQSMSTLNC